MVGFSSIAWLSGRHDGLKLFPNKRNANNQLGILAFEAAKTMSRVLSLYKSLSDDEILKLREDVKSEGVLYLNSDDESFLQRLACAERVEDLDKTAVAVAMLGRKCSDFALNRFEMIYDDMKRGTMDLGRFGYGSKGTEKKINKMEKLLWATSSLYESLEKLSEMEISERKLNVWKKNCSPVQMKTMNFEAFEQKITQQRKEVKQFRENSLWTRSFDETVRLMARMVCVVYARVCDVFRPYVSDLRQREFKKHLYRSGPLISNPKMHVVRFHSQRVVSSLDREAKNDHVFHAAGPKTVGGCGLEIRYAKLVLMAEEYMDTAATDEGREEMYKMLPENLKLMVKSKLSKHVRTSHGGGGGGGGGGCEDELLAGGWREAVHGILRWLAPMAYDTLQWQMERNFEKSRFETRPTVLLMQTLHFADKEKAEAAIAEVLVGLSCIYMYENRRSHDGR